MENFRHLTIDHPRTMIYRAIHHNVTTKTPHQTAAFPKTPSKNAHKTLKKSLSLPL
jgi:hypothetical protein